MKNKTRQTDARQPRLRWRMVVAYASIFVAAPTVTFFFGQFLDSALGLPAFPAFPLNLVAGSAVFLFGLAIGIKSTRLLYLEGQGLPWGEVEKQTRSTRLVTTGLYECCRNPMTFGYALLPCGMGLMFRSLTMAFLIPAIVFTAMIVWLLRWEEPRLEQRFGQVYLDYKRRTPFLLPRFKLLMRYSLGSVRHWWRNQKRKSTERERPD